MSEPCIPEAYEADEVAALLELRALPGIGDLTLQALIEEFGSARAALQAPAERLGARAAAQRGSKRVRGWVERALATIDRADVTLMTWRDATYPSRLRVLHDPPSLLFARGRLDLLKRRSVAVVGSRRPTVYGAQAAAVLAGDLARAGVVVISGMARGIDAAAHEASLEWGTIGVLGCGIDVTYPREQAALFERMAADGLLLSEFLPGEPPVAHNFPRRNRIIAALAHGVLVVEAAAKSGALITVDHALDLGREVFAVPGPIGRPTSEGTHRMIQDGAKLVTCAEDVLEEVPALGEAVDDGASGVGGAVPGIAGSAPGIEGMQPAIEGAARTAGRTTPPVEGATPLRHRRGRRARAGQEKWSREPGPRTPPGLTGDDVRLWDALDVDARHVDAIAADCGLGTVDTLVRLLELELRGHVRQLPGKLFVRA